MVDEVDVADRRTRQGDAGGCRPGTDAADLLQHQFLAGTQPGAAGGGQGDGDGAIGQCAGGEAVAAIGRRGGGDVGGDAADGVAGGDGDAGQVRVHIARRAEGFAGDAEFIPDFAADAAGRGKGDGGDGTAGERAGGAEVAAGRGAVQRRVEGGVVVVQGRGDRGGLPERGDRGGVGVLQPIEHAGDLGVGGGVGEGDCQRAAGLGVGADGGAAEHDVAAGEAQRAGAAEHVGCHRAAGAADGEGGAAVIAAERGDGGVAHAGGEGAFE